MTRFEESLPRILLVDDDHLSRRAMRRLLELKKLGTITEADCAEAALDLIDDLQPDLIVSDCSMPGMDGDELLRRVAQSHPKLPRVMVSGSMPDNADELKKSGVLMAGLAKPYKPTELIRVVQDILQMQPTDRAAGD